MCIKRRLYDDGEKNAILSYLKCVKKFLNFMSVYRIFLLNYSFKHCIIKCNCAVTLLY